MDIRFTCPTCDHHMVIDDAAVGLVVQCTDCGQNVIVPKPAEPQPDPAANPVADSEPKVVNEKTVAIKWVPPSTSPRVEPKK